MKSAVDESGCEKSVDGNDCKKSVADEFYNHLKKWLLAIMVEFWFAGIALIVGAGVLSVAVSANWRQLGLTYDAFESLENWLRNLMLFSLILAGVSCIFNAKFQDTK